MNRLLSILLFLSLCFLAYGKPVLNLESIRDSSSTSCCGTTSIEADKCFTQCQTKNDCPRSQRCFEVSDPPTYTTKCCGTSVFNAISTCPTKGINCFVKSDCPGDGYCYSIPPEYVDLIQPKSSPKPKVSGCCGLTSVDSDLCVLRCSTSVDCPRAEKCFTNPNPPKYDVQCCGTSLFRAASGCKSISCFTKSDCSGDERCYAIPPQFQGLPPIAGKDTGCCGGTAIEADRCFVRCKTKTDCPRSQTCFENSDPPPFDRTCCGTTLFGAASCAKSNCFSKSDCQGDDFCYRIPNFS